MVLALEVIGVDLGKTAIRGRRISIASGVRRGSLRIELRGALTLATPQTTTTEIIKSCGRAIRSLITPDGSVAAAGIGAFGVVDPWTGCVVRSGFFPFWKNVPLADALTEICGVSCFVINDVAAAAGGIRHLQHGREADSFVLVQLGTSVGISAGGGHLEGLWARPDFGQVSQLVDSTGVDVATRLGGHSLGRRGSSVLGREHTAQEIFAKAADGNVASVALVASYISCLAEFCAGIAVLLAPDIIYLGGGMSNSLGPFLPDVLNQFNRRISYLLKPPSLTISHYEDGPQIGAAVWARERMLDDRRAA